MVSVGNSIQFNKLTLASLDMNTYEALDRTLQNLSMLDETVNQMTMKFGNEQNQYRERIQKFIERVTVCQQKIAALQDQKKAIVFTSPSQYVMKYNFSTEQKPSLLKDFKQKHSIQQFEANFGYNLRNDQLQVGELVDQSRIEDAYQTHQIAFGKFHTRQKAPFENRKFPLKEKTTGLGAMPKHLRCAESLLVLNTNLNPYKRYQMVDNLILDENKYQQRVKPTNDNHINLQDAPTEINQILLDYKPTEYTYNPHTKQVKDTVPIPFKMDLDGIAEDYDIDIGDNELIQPSANMMKNKNVLPDPYLNKTQSSTQQQPTQNQQQTTQPQQQYQQQQPQQQQYQAQPSAPPAPIINMNTPTPAGIPAAPPLNIPAAPTIDLPSSSAPPQPQEAAPVELSGRNALLDEIRNPKIKLRKTVTKIKGQLNSDKQNEETTEAAAIPKTSQGIDPMEEIKKAIGQRFRSIHPPSRKAQKSRTIVGGSENESNSQNSSDENDQ